LEALVIASRQTHATAGFILSLVGGGAYSVGVIFYVNKCIPFNYAIWHGFVFMGALNHCWLIASYVLTGGQI
jgi:hemolysin III